MTSRIPDPGDPFEEEGLPTGQDNALDRKRITGDQQEGVPLPAESPQASADYGTTAAEERAGEPLDLRLTREVPDLTAAGGAADESPNAATPYPEDPDERQGRLVEADEGARRDDEPDASAYDVGTDAGGFSAEERAVHIQPEA